MLAFVQLLLPFPLPYEGDSYSKEDQGFLQSTQNFGFM